MAERLLGHVYSGAGWVVDTYGVKLSPVAQVAADIIGFVWGGIYHLPASSIRNADWDNPHFFSILIDGGIATHDDSRLTWLVLLAHELGVRVEIQAASPRSIRLLFHLRDRREPSRGIWSWHPTIESAIERLRAACPTVFTPDTEEVGAAAP